MDKRGSLSYTGRMNKTKVMSNIVPDTKDEILDESILSKRSTKEMKSINFQEK
jgi:hypothetical protein